MRPNKEPEIGIAGPTRPEARLDVVVLFTNPELTLAALRAAHKLGEGLHASIRLLKVQVVPFPMERSPVPLEFIRQQLRRLSASVPAKCEIRLARDFDEGLDSAIDERSLVILGTRKRPWRTRGESIARRLRKAGYTAVLVSPEEENNYA